MSIFCTIGKKLKLSFIAAYKRILKISAIVAIVIVVLGYGPVLLSILLNIDNPLSGTELVDLGLGALAIFVFILVALSVIISVFLTILVLWRVFWHTQVKETERVADSKLQPPQPPQADISRPFSPSIITAIGGVSGFVYFLYYVGRAYSDGYSAYLGIPSVLIHYEIQDYIYLGAQIDTIWITLLFTAILVGFVLTWFRQYPNENKAQSLPLTARVFPYALLIYWIWYSGALLVLLLWQVFRPDLLLEKAVILMALASCMFLLGSLALVFHFDSSTFVRLRTGKTTSTIFAIVIAVTLLVAPYMNGKAWGSFKAFVAGTLGFPTIQIYANGPIVEGITWTLVGNLTYRSDSALYLILNTPDYLILKSTDANSPVYVLKQTEIRSFTVTGMGKLR